MAILLPQKQSMGESFLRVQLASRSYDIAVGAESLATIGAFAGRGAKAAPP